MQRNYGDGDEPPQGPQLKTQAELTLLRLLDKQLDTSGRLEQVEFQGAFKASGRTGYGCSGITTLEEFKLHGVREKQADNETKSEADHITGKRKRYGAHPSFVEGEMTQEHNGSFHLNWENPQEKITFENNQLKLGRHEKELEVSLLQGKGRLKEIAHLSVDGVTLRKPLLGDIDQGVTPQERVRARAGIESTRTAAEVFSSPAPAILDLSTYLQEKQAAACADTRISEPVADGLTDMNLKKQDGTSPLESIPEQEILSARLSEAEICKWGEGKFVDHTYGEPSKTLYIKNLSSTVVEADLVRLFLRFQEPDEQISFRLMQKGRLKGQAFVTFPDKDKAEKALHLIHGYMLKGKPIVIQYGRGP